MKISFLVHPSSVPTLLSFARQKEMQAVTNMKDLTFSVGGEALPLCCTAENGEEKDAEALVTEKISGINGESARSV